MFLHLWVIRNIHVQSPTRYIVLLHHHDTLSESKMYKSTSTNAKLGLVYPTCLIEKDVIDLINSR